MTIETVRFWTSRWGDMHCIEDPDCPDEATLSRIVDFFPDNNMTTCECAFGASVNGRPGLLIEWEYAQGVRPLPSLIAHWRLMAPKGCLFDCYSGTSGRPTYEDAWVAVAFIPLPLLSTELVAEIDHLFDAIPVGAA